MKIGVLKLYYLLFIFISFGVVISLSILNGVRIYLYDIPVILTSPIAVFYLWNIQKQLANAKYLLLFLLIGFLGLFFYLSNISELLGALAYLIRLILYLLLSVPIFFFSKKEIGKLIKVIIALGALFTIIGYIQYALYNDLSNLYYLGWDRHLYRFFSTFLDPNFAGIYLVLLFVFTISFFQAIHSKRKIQLMVLTVILYLPAIFLTYSRTTYITLIVAVSSYLFFFNKKLVAIFLVVFAVLLFILPKSFGGEGVNLLRTYSIVARLDAGEIAYSVFIQSPILGVGFNAFKYAQLREGVLSPAQLNSHAASGVPNSYLFILATTGIVGFLFLFAFLKSILKNLLSISRNDLNTYIFSRAVFSGILGVLVASMFENALFYSPILIFLIILSALSFRVKKLSD